MVDPAGLLGEAPAEVCPDLTRSLRQKIVNEFRSEGAYQVAGAEYGRPSTDRVTQCNCYRHHDLDTRVAEIDRSVPKPRAGTYFPDWLLERSKRAELAQTTVVADCYFAGVSTRRTAPRCTLNVYRTWGPSSR